MTTTASSVARRFACDTSEEDPTRVYVRPPTTSWERGMVRQIMRDLAAPARPAQHPRAEPSRQPSPAAVVRSPNVFLTPAASDALAPWASGARSASEARSPWASARRDRGHEASGARPVVAIERAPVRRSILPWLVFAMSFGIAYGVARDPALRAELREEVIQSADRAVAVSAARLESWRK